MYPVNATNLYKACLAGVRRQRYWIIAKYSIERTDESYIILIEREVPLLSKSMVEVSLSHNFI